MNLLLTCSRFIILHNSSIAAVLQHNNNVNNSFYVNIFNYFFIKNRKYKKSLAPEEQLDPLLEVYVPEALAGFLVQKYLFQKLLEVLSESLCEQQD